MYFVPAENMEDVLRVALPGALASPPAAVTP
jgi:hypothetical protein